MQNILNVNKRKFKDSLYKEYINLKFKLTPSILPTF